ncbi:hypothetical protein M9458_050570 [Cirrhinus mrigala]|uniref:Reverse transcriptase RNase H-like domain-containing protein n=1 Tax=Cirrhinus mrigala TaxID=683832 RepID=A0ABD0MZV4_CIRMR
MVHRIPRCPSLLEISLPTLPVPTPQSSARKRSGAGELATPAGVSTAASSAASCRSSVTGHRTSSSNNTRGQSQETGSLSRLFGSVETTAKCICLGPAHCRARLLHSIWRSAATFQRGLPTLVGPEQGLVMEQEVGTLLGKAIEVAPPHVRESGFYSRYFIVPKKEGEVAFRSEECIPPHIHPSTQEVPEIRFGGKAYLCWVLPSSLALSPCTFTNGGSGPSGSPRGETRFTHQGHAVIPTCLGHVEEALVPVSGPGAGSSLLPRNASDGCIPHRLGSGHGRPPCPWSVALPPSHLAYHCLEMLAMFQALKHFLPDLRDRPVLVRTDSTTVSVTSTTRELSATEVVETILQSRAPSTRKLYALKWKPFTSWCEDRQQDSVNCPVGTVLGFLQDRFSTGLAHSNLKVYVAAILAYHAPLGGSSVAVLFHTRQGFEVWWRGHLVPIAFLTQLEFLKGNISGYVCNHGSPRERDAASRAILPASLQRLLVYSEAAGCMHHTCF